MSLCRFVKKNKIHTLSNEGIYQRVVFTVDNVDHRNLKIIVHQCFTITNQFTLIEIQVFNLPKGMTPVKGFYKQHRNMAPHLPAALGG